MARLRVPAMGQGSIGTGWALTVLLGVMAALAVVGVIRSTNTGRAGEP